MVSPEGFVGKSKWKLDTPCLVVDLDQLEKNIERMQAHAARFGKQLRPHAKTHKCSRIAALQIKAGCAGICVAKVSEAEVLVDKSIRGVLITSPVVTEYKIRRLIDCVSRDPELMVVVDHEKNARSLNDAASQRGVRLNVLVDLDPGMGRTGAAFDQGPALGRVVDSLSSLRLRGVQCYAGHVQHIASFDDRLCQSLDWLKQAAGVVRQLRQEGLPCDIFTGSGTGTHEIDHRIPELTDLQVGSYTMMDADYLRIGSSENPSGFENFPPALTLLTSVVSINHPGFVTVDAGLKALYRDGGTPYVINPSDPTLRYEWRGDEHGKIILSDSSVRPGLGDVLEMVVSHCDPTVNLFDVLYMTRKETVTEVWTVDMRGRCQ
jgi:D-serine deaminase-like pyridoxal phosphate-dependent protein